MTNSPPDCHIDLIFRIGRPPCFRREDIKVPLPDSLPGFDPQFQMSVDTAQSDEVEAKQRRLFIAQIGLADLLYDANHLVTNITSLDKLEKSVLELEAKVSQMTVSQAS